MASAFVLSVFGGPDATGNPTGVVVLDSALAEPRCQSIATLLGLPDTVFTWAVSGRQKACFFSPVETLTACSHALLGAAHVLDRASVEFELPDRALRVERFDSRYWVRTPAAL